MPDEAVIGNIDSCTSQVVGKDISAISSDVEYFYILQKAFPYMAKYQWYIGNILERRYKRMVISKILFSDKTVKVMLTSRE